MKLPIRFKPHPIRILIVQTRANGVFPIFDRGLRYKNERGEWWYHLKRQNYSIRPPNLADIYHEGAIEPTKKESEDSVRVQGIVPKSGWLFLANPEPGVFSAYHLEPFKGTILDKDLMYWAVLSMRESYELWKTSDKWEAFKPFLYMGAIVLGFFIIAMILRSEVIKPLDAISERLMVIIKELGIGKPT